MLTSKILDVLRDLLRTADEDLTIEVRNKDGEVRFAWTAIARPQPNAPMPEPAPGPSPDYRYLQIGDQHYVFSASQAKVVALLWQANGQALSGDYLLSEAEYEGRMCDLFKRHPAWGTLIVPGLGKGTYRLIPENLPKTD